jgi:DNA-binding NarL/FixJ family response regulator
MATRVILAHDQEILRAGLKSILEKHSGMEVVGECGDGRTALRLCVELLPELAILHTRLPELNGIETARQVRAQCPPTHAILIAENADRHLADQALQAGASAYLLADSSAAELQLAITAATSGGIYITPKAASVMLGGPKDPRVQGAGAYSALSPREREVLQLVAEGRSTPEIATRLSISARTIDIHRRQLAKKLGLRGVAELTKYAIREGITAL